jgi:DNA-directed RNA polymerase specialized sigma subunit
LSKLRRFYAPPTARQRELFAEHQWLVEWLLPRIGVWRARKAGLARSDLVQAALLGLWRATYAWDPKRGAFSTAAKQRMVGEVLDELDRARFGAVRHGRPLVDQSAFARLPDERDHDHPPDETPS